MKAARFKHRRIQRVHVLIVAMLCAVLLPWRALALDGSLRFAPETQQMVPGDEVTIEVWMDDANGLYGLDLRITYDPSVVEILDENSGVAGVQVSGGAFPYPDFEVKNEVSVEDSQIWYAVTQLNPRDPVNGSGIVLTMRARALAEGTCYLDVAYSKYVNSGGIELDVSSSSGEIHVVSSAGGTIAPPPTRTHTPTSTSTSTATPSLTPTPTSEGVVPLYTPTPIPTDTPLPYDTPQPSATSGPSQTPQPSDTPVPGQPTPTRTRTPYGAYPDPTSQTQPTATTASGAPGPTATPPTGSATRSPLPTLTRPGGPPGYPGPEPGNGEPAAPSVAPTVGPGQPEPTTDPFAAPTAIVAPTQMAQDAPSPAAVAMVMPTLEKVWPRGESERQEQGPLVPRETFICFSAALVLATALVALYIWRRDRVRARQA